MVDEDVDSGGADSASEDLQPTKLTRTKSWKEYDGNDEIPFILAEGFLPIKFQSEEVVSLLGVNFIFRTCASIVRVN